MSRKEKIRKLREQLLHESGSKQKKTKNNSTFFIIVDILVGMIVGGFVGYICDFYLNTLPIFLFICSVLGFFSGFLNVYKNLNKR
ncbi:MAG: F0F1-type ATP synthase assembly protein I [Candidatus Midichloriaceae bacterium]